MNARTHLHFSLADFLAWEETQPGRNEFHRGEVFARVGARRVRQCVLVDPDTHRVESFRRSADGQQWTFHDMSEAEALEAPSIGCAVALADVFDGADPPVETPPPTD